MYTSVLSTVSGILLIICISSTTTAPSTNSKEDLDSSSEEMIVPRHPKISGDKMEYIELEVGEKPKDLECEIQGSPTPKAIWLKNGKDLPHDFESSFSTHSGTSLLELKFKDHIPPAHLPGNYTCVAANFLGKTTKTFLVRINILPEIATHRY